MKNTQTEQRAIEKLKWKNFGGGLYFAPGWKIAKRVNTVTGRKRRPVQKTIWNLTLGVEGVEIRGVFWKIVKRDESGVVIENKKRHWIKLPIEKLSEMPVRKKRIKVNPSGGRK